MKIHVPIPVHVNRFAVRSQHQQLEKMFPAGPKPDLRKKFYIPQVAGRGFEKFKGERRRLPSSSLLNEHQRLHQAQCSAVPRLPQKMNINFYQNHI